jgi:hypothetical protein
LPTNTLYHSFTSAIYPSKRRKEKQQKDAVVCLMC